MTNAQLVNEINRMIRGIALNYPDGLEQIRATLVACTPPFPSTRTEGQSIPQQEETETLLVGATPTGRVIEWLDGSPTPHSPESGSTKGAGTQQERRGPGRPKGSKNKPKGQE